MDYRNKSATSFVGNLTCFWARRLRSGVQDRFAPLQQLVPRYADERLDPIPIREPAALSGGTASERRDAVLSHDIVLIEHRGDILNLGDDGLRTPPAEPPD